LKSAATSSIDALENTKRSVVDASYSVSELRFCDDAAGQKDYQDHPIPKKFIETCGHENMKLTEEARGSTVDTEDAWDNDHERVILLSTAGSACPHSNGCKYTPSRSCWAMGRSLPLVSPGTLAIATQAIQSFPLDLTISGA
jgi:hypothetical protein